jgi:hypothetical protein
MEIRKFSKAEESFFLTCLWMRGMVDDYHGPAA